MQVIENLPPFGRREGLLRAQSPVTPLARSKLDAYADLELPAEEPRAPTALQWAGEATETEAAWLVYEKIPRNGTGMLVAPSRAGKTFLALKLAECLASGEPFFREKPDERCGTLILSAEGNHGLGRRLSALAKLPVAGLAVGALDTPQAVRALVKSIEQARDELKTRFNVRLGLIVLDTLSASLLVQDENNNSDMARAFARLTKLSETFDCLVLATHHTPKGSTGARGAGASFNAADVVIEVFRKGEEAVRSVECMKNKEGPEGKWGSFSLQTVTLGYDAKGRPKTTCLVSLGGVISTDTSPKVEAEEEPPLSPTEFEILSSVMSDHSFNITQTGDTWIGKLIARVADINLAESDGKRQVVQIQKKLEDGGWLKRDKRPDGHGHLRDSIVAGDRLKAIVATKAL